MHASQTRYRVEGMDCASCAAKISTAVRRVPGIEDVSVSVTAGTMTVSHDGAPGRSAAVARQVGALGEYAAIALQDASALRAEDPGCPMEERIPIANPNVAVAGGRSWISGRAATTLACGLAVGVAYLLGRVVPGTERWAFVPAMAVGLVPIARRAFAAAIAGTPFSIEMLMTHRRDGRRPDRSRRRGRRRRVPVPGRGAARRRRGTPGPGQHPGPCGSRAGYRARRTQRGAGGGSGRPDPRRRDHPGATGRSDRGGRRDHRWSRRNRRGAGDGGERSEAQRARREGVRRHGQRRWRAARESHCCGGGQHHRPRDPARRGGAGRQGSDGALHRPVFQLLHSGRRRRGNPGRRLTADAARPAMGRMAVQGLSAPPDRLPMRLGDLHASCDRGQSVRRREARPSVEGRRSAGGTGVGHGSGIR